MQGAKQPALWGQAWAPNPQAVTDLTGGMGAKFDVYPLPADAGNVDLAKGDPSVNVCYFNLHGRAEWIRAMLWTANVPFNNEEIA